MPIKYVFCLGYWVCWNSVGSLLKVGNIETVYIAIICFESICVALVLHSIWLKTALYMQLQFRSRKQQTTVSSKKPRKMVIWITRECYKTVWGALWLPSGCPHSGCPHVALKNPNSERAGNDILVVCQVDLPCIFSYEENLSKKNKNLSSFFWEWYNIITRRDENYWIYC